MQFEDLPKDMKEKIWIHLDEKQLFIDRIISKSWRRGIENPKSIILQERYQRGKESSEK